MADFSQYLNDYLDIKRRRGVTPGVGESSRLFSPYFDKQAAVNIAGQKMDLAEKNLTLAQQTQTAKESQDVQSLAWNKENTINNLALEKWRQGELANQAGRLSTMATVGNVIQSAAPLGSLYWMKKYGYLDPYRRT